MSDADRLRELLEAGAVSLELSKERINDLNVYPVPDGDTGTNMALTVRGTLDGLEGLDDVARPAVARAMTRAALMSARGNSGVILSQIVRGAADVLAEEEVVDAEAVARALRAASDSAYRGVKRPVEGTMLTVIREMAEEAGCQSDSGEKTVADLLRAVLARGEAALAATPELLSVLKEAGVVDAGGAGLVELTRGIVAGVTGESLPAPPSSADVPGIEAVHHELSEYRYCTAFVVEGPGLDASELEPLLEKLGDSLLVVGDDSALKVHVHTDDPGAALSLGTARGSIAGVEIADMHAQTLERSQRLAARTTATESGVVAVVAGKGNRTLYESITEVTLVDGGQSMNPSTADLVAAIGRTDARSVLVLPNNGNVIMSAEQAAALAEKPVYVVPTRSIQAGLAALLAFESGRPGLDNLAVMTELLAEVATAAVTTASRDVELNGLRIRRGQYLGLLDDEPVVGGDSFDEVARGTIDALLSTPHDVLTLLAGDDAPALDELVAAVGEQHPSVEVDVQEGGQPHYHLLIAAE
jgi:DAK2 domain fusion protein YloV